MENIYSYDISEFQGIALPPAPESCTSNENSTTNWRNITVAHEVGRGIKLRANKHSSYRRKEIVPIGPNLKKRRNTRKRLMRKNPENNTCPGCSHWISQPRSKSMKPFKTRRQKAIFKFLKKGDKTRRCSMRTAELAVPTKRHCIDTWRTKSYLLPEFMVERLKQQVLDLRPVVKIPDALFCFQRRKRRLRKKSTKNNIVNKWKNQMQMPLRCSDTKTWCLIFAQKIVQRLSMPWSLSLNSELEKLYRVVGSDITQIANGKKHIRNEYFEEDISLHSDVIKKITLWIVSILEDLARKQLEEDLRDLEEEEGPVLDFLDDVVDHVLNLCTPVPSFDNNQEEASIHSGSITSENRDAKLTDSEHFRNEILSFIDNLQVPEENHNIVSDSKEYHEFEFPNIINNFQETVDEKPFDFSKEDYITNTTHFQNEIHKLINKVLKDDESNDEYKSYNDDETTNSIYFENEILNIISIICKETTEQDDEVGQEDELKEVYTTENYVNQRGSVEMLSEDTDDRNSKKVMFSISDMVNPDSTIIRTSETAPELQEEKDKPKNRSTYRPYNIVFGKPNEHLLSDADELWPNEKFSDALLRPSASVTKSITSLGKFVEDDENILPLLDSQTSHEVMLQNDKNHFPSVVLHVEKLDVILSPNEEVTESVETNETLLQKEANEQLNSDLKSKVAEKLALLNNELQEGNISESQKLRNLIEVYLSDQCDAEVQTDKVKIPKEVILEATDITVTSFESNHQVKSVTAKDKSNDVIEATNNIKISKNKGIGNEQKDDVKINNGWKVKLETAPSWLTQTNAHGEPTENVMPPQAKLKLTQSDIHKWCRDLDNGFKNLDIWRDWLQNTCQEAAMLLKKKKERPCAVDKYIKIWRKLKNNVTKDAILWGKINQHTHDTFGGYQKYKANIKIVPSKRTAKCNCTNTPRCDS